MIDVHLLCVEDRIGPKLEFGHDTHSELRQLCFLDRSNFVIRISQDRNEQTEKHNGSDKDKRTEQKGSPDDKNATRRSKHLHRHITEIRADV